jgi:carbonic anhydrase
MDEQTLKMLVFFSVILVLVASIVIIYSSCKRKDYFSSSDAVSVLSNGNKTFHPSMMNMNVKPKVVVLCCSEHHVNVENLFNLKEGEVCVVRELGHVPYLNSMASLEYSIGQLGASALVVLGHSNCAGVKMAMEAQPHGSPFLNFIGDTIQDNIKVEDTLPEAIKHNAQNTLHKIIQSSDIVNGAINANKLAVMWGVHDEKTGKVELIQT